MGGTELDDRTIRDAIEVLTYGAPQTSRSRAVRTYANGRAHWSPAARELYSYGRHFPLARYVPRTGRHGPLWVINGDSWRGPNSRTADHQDSTRRAIADTGVRSVVLPFSALGGAGIVLDSIRPITVRADYEWTETVVADTLDDVPLWRRPDGFRPATVRPDGRYEWTETHHRLGDAVFSAVRGSGRRARYVSSFDYQESPPLYFLAQLPRGAAVDTVDAAIESLAPRAVHAAIARGRAVYRQGDVFFIETDLTREELEARGAVFARLTQWTRDARPRRGEAGYAPPLDAAGRRREARYRARLFREIFRGAVLSATNGETRSARPQTPKGARRKWAKARADHARELETDRAALRRATLGGRATYHGRPRRYTARRYAWEKSPLEQERHDIAAAVKRARESLEARERHGPRLYDSWNREGYRSRAHQRDFYRRLYGTNALAAYNRAALEAARRYRPAEIGDSDAHRRRRAAARAVLAIYGTAHGATETARVPGGGFYASGTVRHVPDLEPGRDGARDHAPLELDSGRWFLAVRNTVPRQR